MTPTRLRTILKRFPAPQILVVGDVMLDQFLWGKVSRISPEAPVPVVEVRDESFFPGGAANVARNLRALGYTVNVDDALIEEVGAHLRRIAQQEGKPLGVPIEYDAFHFEHQVPGVQ